MTTRAHFGHRPGELSVYVPGRNARANEPSPPLRTDVAAPPPWGVALTVALGTAFSGHGSPTRSTGQVGPARTRPVIPPVTASDGGLVIDRPPDCVSGGGAVSAKR